MIQKIPFKIVIWFFTTLALELVGFLLKGPPRDPDVLFGWEQNVGTFCVFLFWASCVLAWGRGLCSLLRLENLGWFGAALFGTLGASWAAMILGHLGLVGISSGGLAVVLLLGGFVVNLAYRNHDSVVLEVKSKPEWETIVAIAAIGIFLGVRMLQAFLAHGTSDPALYHLLAPRLWFDRGEIYFSQDAPITFQASYWEYLFLWGNLLLGGPVGKGLIEGQLFGQWTHVFFGGGGLILALWYFLGDFFKNRLALGLVLFCGISWTSLASIAVIAKNDWGAIFWVVSGSVLLLDEAKIESIWNCILGGLILGVAFVSKLTLGVWIFSFLLFWEIFGIRVRGRALFYVFVGLAAGVLPIFVRNYVATGNPVFPTLNFIFASPWLAPSHQLSTLSDHGGLVLAPALLWIRMKFFLHDSYGFMGIAFLPFVWKQIRWVKPLKILAVTTFVVVLFFLFWEFQFGFLRWVGPGLVFFGVAGGACTVLLIQNLFRKKASQSIVFAIFLFLIAWKSTDFHILSQPFVSTSPSMSIRDPEIHLGGDSKAWLRMNASVLDLVVTTGDNQLYYLSHMNVVAIRDRSDWDQITYQLQFAWELVEALDRLGVKYLLDTRHWDNVYWGRVSFLVNGLAFRYPESVVYEGSNSFVIDFDKLRESFFQACRMSETKMPTSGLEEVGT